RPRSPCAPFPPSGSASQPTGDLVSALSRGYPIARGSHTPQRRCSGGEEGEAGREPVQEVAGADRAEFPGAEAPRQGEGAEELVDDAGVVGGPPGEPLPPPVAGEEDGGVGLGRGQEVAEVLVGRAGVADLELHGAPDGNVV